MVREEAIALRKGAELQQSPRERFLTLPMMQSTFLIGDNRAHKENRAFWQRREQHKNTSTKGTKIGK
jgi:hypothetical protein